MRLGGEKLADALLPDDGVGLTAESGSHEDVLNIAEAADLAVEEIFTIAGAEEAASNGEFAGTHRGAAKLAATNLQDHVIRIGELGCGVGLGGGREDVWPLGLALDDSAGLSLCNGLFRLFCAQLTEGGFIPVGGQALVDDDLWVVLKAGTVVDLGVDKGEGDLGHAGGLAVAGAGEDDIFHLDTAEAFSGLFAQYPGDRVGDVGFAAAIGTYDGGDAFA